MTKMINIESLTVHKGATVAFRLPAEVKAALHELATSKGQTMAEFCEKLVVRELQREGIEIVITAKLV
jgi:predicted DNA-binding protein